MNQSSVATAPMPASSAALRVQSGPVAPATRRALEPAEIFSRMAIVAMFTVLAVRLGLDYASSGRMTVLLLLASEALVVVLTVFRRPTGIVDRSPRARLLTVVSLCTAISMMLEQYIDVGTIDMVYLAGIVFVALNLEIGRAHV